MVGSASLYITVSRSRRKALSIRTRELLDVAPDSAAPSDLENHNYSMSEVLAELAVSLIAIVFAHGNYSGTLDVGYKPRQVDCMLLGLVLARAMADNTEDSLQPSRSCPSRK